MHRPLQRRRPLHAGFLISCAVFLCSCGDAVRPPQQAGADLESARRLAALMEPCGVSFRAILVNDDPEDDANYGWGPQVDTIDVCETWVGGDYRFAARTVGTTEKDGGPAVYDMARDGAYQNGTHYTTQQGNIVQSQQVGETLFDMVYASPGQVQASYDDPYYGVASNGGCPNGCIFNKGSAAQAADGPKDSLYRRHGLKRRGVRALVDGMDETGPSPEGFRRFTKKKGVADQTILVHPAAELIMGEDYRDDKVEIKTRHHWTPTSYGYGRERTDIEVKEHGGGRVRVKRMTQIITNLQVAPRDPNN